MKKIEIKKKILITHILIYLFSFLIIYSFLMKNVKTVFELSFSISSKTPYEIELLIGNDYRQKKAEFFDSLINKYQNSNQNIYLNDYFSSSLFYDFNAGAIANTSFKYAVNSVSSVKEFKKILEESKLSKNIKDTIMINLFVNDMFNFKNFRRISIKNERSNSPNYKFSLMLKGISEKDLVIFSNEFKSALEKRTLNYAKKLFVINVNTKFLKNEINNEIAKIKNNTKVINFYVDRVAARTLNFNLILFFSFSLPIIVILTIELLRLLILKKINIKLF
jgi:hypothetical protein